MIDFKNADFLKLRAVERSAYDNLVSPILVPDERVHAAFKGIRDGVVFTTKRIIVINVQGITGKKVDITSLPYSKIQAYSIETAGTIDLDSELELWFSGLGRIKLEFVARTNVAQICKLISVHAL